MFYKIIVSAFFAFFLSFTCTAVNSTNQTWMHLGIEKVERIKVIVHPSPLNDQIMISVSDHPERTSFSVFDLQGNVVFNIDYLPSNLFTLSYKDFLPGVYFYQVKFEDKLVVSGRFAKHKIVEAA